MSRAIENEVWDYAPEELTPSAFILLLALADVAGDGHRMAWLAVPTLQQKARGSSERNVYYVLAQLKALGILEDVPKDQWPPEALLYKSVVRRIRPREKWGTPPAPSKKSDPPNRDEPGAQRGAAKFAPPVKVVTETSRGANFAPPVTVVTPSPKRATKSAGGVQNLHPSKSSLRALEEPSVLRMHPSGGMRQSKPDRVPSRRQEAERKAAAEAELDPAKVFGMNSDPEPATETRSKRRPPGLDTGMGLALEFQRCVRKSSDLALAPSPVNIRALAKHFSDWLRSGVDNQLVLAAINAYIEVPAYRNPKAVPWKDFLAQRALLLERARREVAATEDKNDPNYWRTDRDEEDHPGLHNKDYWL